MLDTEYNIIIVVICSFLGLFWGVFNAILLSKVKLTQGQRGGESYNQLQEEEQGVDPTIYQIQEVGSYIERCSNAFLVTEFKFIGVFVVIIAFVIFFAVEESLGYLWTTVAFLLGAICSSLVTLLGLRIAVSANYKTAYKIHSNPAQAFSVAYKAGCTFGFTAISLGLLLLSIIICVYTNLYVVEYEDFTDMYQSLAGFGLGASVLSLFGRVSGGIFSQSVEVGCDNIGRLDQDFKYSISNPAIIANKVGDNVRDVVGNGTDEFGSFAEATSAALVIAAISPTFYYQPSAFWYILMITAFGIIACIITSILAQNKKTESVRSIYDTLKQQLYIATILSALGLIAAAYITLPERLFGFASVDRAPLHAWVCTIIGLFAGLLIGIINDSSTNYSCDCVKDVAKEQDAGSLHYVNHSFALGSASTIVPIVLLAIAAFISFTLLGAFGIALAALGLLSTIAIVLAVDTFGPIAGNAAGIVEMCNLPENVRGSADNLDSAGQNTSSIGKGYSIAGAAFVALALFGAYLLVAGKFENAYPISVLNMTTPIILAGLLIGSILPHAFIANINSAVGKSTGKLVNEVAQQTENNADIKNGARPDYERCTTVVAKQSLVNLFWPVFICVIIPFAVGMLFGAYAIAGLIAGIILSGASLGLAYCNTGSIFENSRRFIESGQFQPAAESVAKKLTGAANQCKSLIGHPLKNQSGIAISILIKLTAIFSLIFFRFFDKTAFLQCHITSNINGCK